MRTIYKETLLTWQSHERITFNQNISNIICWAWKSYEYYFSCIWVWCPYEPHIHVTVGLVWTGPLACLSPFAVMSVDKGNLIRLRVSKLPCYIAKTPWSWGRMDERIIPKAARFWQIAKRGRVICRILILWQELGFFISHRANKAKLWISLAISYIL